MPPSSVSPRAPKQGRSRQSFDRIIEATIALLRERSYDEVTLAEICRQSGVSTGSLYGRVAGKDALLQVVQARFLQRLHQQFSDEAARIAREARGLEQVVPAVVTSLGTLLKENASVLRSFMLHAPRDEVIRTAGRRSAQEDAALFIGLLQACGEQIRHPLPERAIESAMLLIYSTQARFLGIDSVDGIEAGNWNDLLTDLGDMMLAFLLFVPRR